MANDVQSHLGGWLPIRRAGVMVVLDVGGPHLPRIVYWGRDLGDLDADQYRLLAVEPYTTAAPTNYPDVPLTLSPSRAQGWDGWPGLTGHRDGFASQPLFTLAEVSLGAAPDGDLLRYAGVDDLAGLRLDGELELTVDGVLRHRQTLTNVAADAAYTVDDLLTVLPVPSRAMEVLDYTGRWANEAQPQRRTLDQGTWLREQRRGRTGPDSPLLLSIGTPGFTHREGEVWGIHLGWSADQRYLAQRLNDGYALVGAGEILAAGEVILAPGEALTTPWAYGVFSDRGLDGASARLHAMLRRRPGHVTSPRPIVVNTWEAVYFDQSFPRLAALADAAAEVGAERFVLDDGWFGSRRDDTRGLGDWYVSDEVWPDGLGPLADHVRSRGMDFGLWFEPEMVNPDSDLARAHPDWVIGTDGRMPPSARHQQVLDVSHPQAYAYLRDRMSDLIAQYQIGYLKWDHNRDVADPVHRGGPRAGRPALREQTLAVYRLMDELRTRHPGLEIESCSSGGSRVDYGVLAHTDRVWASDCIDPLERVGIVAGISTLLPFELIGAHVGSRRSHTTGRQQDLPLRLAVATFGHAGIESDLTSLSSEELGQFKQWVAFVKSVRPLVHSGEVVRIDRPEDPGTVLYGVVSADGREGLFNLVRLRSGVGYETAPLRLGGVRPSLRYHVTRVPLPGEDASVHGLHPRTGVDGVVVAGTLLRDAGLPAPSLRPEQAAMFHLRAVDGEEQ
ncbi:alpha-galactosidase [Rugosimonospora acidiphila]|uniref:alpha-galactosidase n=1 Tax=Rugosimonospora acidiphila TaxID=556531 RepID=A0ABP9RRS1_9ACTN